VCFLFLNVGVACHYYGVKECCACAQRKIVCFLFLYVEVACHYYGAKMLRMRITGNCVFLYVTHAHNGRGFFCFYVLGLHVVITVQKFTHAYNRMGNKSVTLT
jgi:hypothetical protein